jgi:hypothetical protein
MRSEDLISKWTARREDWSRVKAQVDGVLVCDELLSDILALLTAGKAALLTLRQAAEVSGYSEDHLGRQVLQGKIPNAGRKGSPRIKTGDLPRRIVRTGPRLYDPVTDARNLLNS